MNLASRPASMDSHLPDTPPEEGSVTEAGAPPPAVPDPSGPATPSDTDHPERIEILEDVPARVDPAHRYVRKERLGAGGMGEVTLCRDEWIGRDVALKTMHPGQADLDKVRRRFFQEMQVQGQLEHPSIVPVHDFGVDPEGRLYFTMRRVRGPTLRHVLQGLAGGDEEITARFSRRKLLTAFVSVCLAVHHAHTRGVLHRDLKPSNIMLGELGEVYVLDWGVAKVFADAAGPARGKSLSLEGALIGTPAYMAPEQLLAKSTLDARTDVYSLGVVLFELLAREALHQGRDTKEIIQATLTGLETRPSTRGVDVPPELDAVCQRATERDPARRFATAQEMADAIERYLDGDRDLERRRLLADHHAENAARAARRALAPETGAPAAEVERAAAMREVVKALAFDPAHTGATRTLVEVLVKVPKDLPAEVVTEMEAAHDRSRRQNAKMLMLTFLLWLGFVPAGLFVGVRSWASLAFSGAAALAGLVVSWAVSRSRSLGSGKAYLLALLVTIATASVSAWLGPFVVIPMVAATMTLLFTALSMRKERLVLTLLCTLMIVGPVAAELLGLVPPSMAFEGGRIVLLPRAYEFPPRATWGLLLYTSLAWILLPPFLLGRMRDALNSAQQELFLHAWHFRRLLPKAAE